MGADLRAHSPRAQALFDFTDAVTGLPITRLCADGPLDRLTETDVAQPAVVATSLAALAVLREELDPPFAAVAGHSVGEYSAYAAAGVFDDETALRLVHARAQAMASACHAVDGTMAAVIGLEEQPLRTVCLAASHNGSSVEIANLNAPGNVIVSGARDALERLTASARQAGARRILPLNVGGPFHSVYMRPAADALSTALGQVQFSRATVPIVLNACAQPSQEPAVLQEELAVQLYSPVHWTETLRRLVEMGCDRFLEVGPGKVVAGLVRRTLPEAKVASFGSLHDLAAVRELVA